MEFLDKSQNNHFLLLNIKAASPGFLVLKRGPKDMGHPVGYFQGRVGHFHGFVPKYGVHMSPCPHMVRRP